MKHIILLIFTGVLISFSGFCETLTVGFYRAGLPPLFFQEGDTRTGIYRDILHEIEKITGDKFVTKYSSQKRIITSFGRDFDLEPGISPIWRPHQTAISVYSEPLYTHREVIFGKSGVPTYIVGPKSLRGRRVGMIWGYLYPGWMPTDVKYTPIYADNEGLLFKMMRKDRFEVGFAGETIAKFHAKEVGLDIVILHTMYQTEVALRIHVSKKDVLERIDKAIRGLHETGKIQEIIDSYTE